MGDMADYSLSCAGSHYEESWQSDEGQERWQSGKYRRKKIPLHCSYCGDGPFRWNEFDGMWRLVDRTGNTHKCLQYIKHKGEKGCGVNEMVEIKWDKKLFEAWVEVASICLSNGKILHDRETSLIDIQIFESKVDKLITQLEQLKVDTVQHLLNGKAKQTVGE